ncbi:hypothetical protein C5H21_12280 [Xylella fastidiosa]|nr:hypothetical protein C5H21_12380 [Xylella fastidiosa]TNV97686.1 hypothetical protein C5H21_12345 [Xylella fastidiosa]TNV97696.1 hypothetical protein C5H21_12280 [Xylella fastidiosa]
MGELTGLNADLAQLVRLALAEQAEDVYLFAARLLRKYRGLSRSWLSDGAGSHCPSHRTSSHCHTGGRKRRRLPKKYSLQSIVYTSLHAFLRLVSYKCKQQIFCNITIRVVYWRV